MNISHSFPCPNCGSGAFRRHFVTQKVDCPRQQAMTTECPVCDYLMTVCSLNGKLIETSSSQFNVKLKIQSIIKQQKLTAEGDQRRHRRFTAVYR